MDLKKYYTHLLLPVTFMFFCIAMSGQSQTNIAFTKEEFSKKNEFFDELYQTSKTLEKESVVYEKHKNIKNYRIKLTRKKALNHGLFTIVEFVVSSVLQFVDYIVLLQNEDCKI